MTVPRVLGPDPPCDRVGEQCRPGAWRPVRDPSPRDRDPGAPRPRPPPGTQRADGHQEPGSMSPPDAEPWAVGFQPPEPRLRTSTGLGRSDPAAWAHSGGTHFPRFQESGPVSVSMCVHPTKGGSCTTSRVRVPQPSPPAALSLHGPAVPWPVHLTSPAWGTCRPESLASRSLPPARAGATALACETGRVCPAALTGGARPRLSLA